MPGPSAHFFFPLGLSIDLYHLDGSWRLTFFTFLLLLLGAAAAAGTSCSLEVDSALGCFSSVIDTAPMSCSSGVV